MCGRFDAPGERQSTAAASTENEKDMQLPEKEATGGRVTAPPPPSPATRPGVLASSLMTDVITATTTIGINLS